MTANEILSEICIAESETVEVDMLTKDECYRQLMAEADRCLNKREKTVLQSRYGLGDGGAAKTLREIGSDLGLSKERVRQVQLAAVEKLQDLAGELKLSIAAL